MPLEQTTSNPLRKHIEDLLAAADKPSRDNDALDLISCILSYADACSGPASHPSLIPYGATAMLQVVDRFRDRARAAALIEASNAVNSIR